MTQTRTFLIVAWLVVAFLLWDAWQKDQHPRSPAEAVTTTSTAVADQAIPAADGSVPAVPQVSAGPAEASLENAPLEAPRTRTLTLSNDVLSLSLDANGGAIVGAALLAYPAEAKGDAQPVQLLSAEPEHLFVVQSGLVGQAAVPAHDAQMQAQSGDQHLAESGNEVSLNFVWHGENGLEVERSYRLTRGSYLVEITDTVRNKSSANWTGNAYHQLVRVPPPKPKGGFTNPQSLSFVGAAWYSPQDKFEKLKFGDFDPKEPLQRTVTDGWIAMLQHYFVAAIVPARGEATAFNNAVLSHNRYLVREMGNSLSVAAGAQASTKVQVYLGPKLRDQLEAVAPGLGLSLDYGIFTAIAQPIHWLLALLHSLFGNWGWAIVFLVVLIKAALFKLSEAQYKSFARMRRIQPRLEALKERFGDDRQKYQTAMMELYKKEKINPLGGCLPILVQFPVFLSLYWVLIEAVELRQAPWILWIQNLSAPDPYFILPALNLVTMWATQKLSPTPGMDPMQKRMMQMMPLVFGVMFAFFPAGLVLYWTTNGLLGLLQQWYIMRRHGEPAAAAAIAK
ncbi:MAG: membrane protein insertase YidC [Xanthomonadales bacterium]|nr:membrane protein insertase YidC [Xanthomonadales bacterium]